MELPVENQLCNDTEFPLLIMELLFSYLLIGVLLYMLSGVSFERRNLDRMMKSFYLLNGDGSDFFRIRSVCLSMRQGHFWETVTIGVLKHGAQIGI